MTALLVALLSALPTTDTGVETPFEGAARVVVAEQGPRLLTLARATLERAVIHGDTEPHLPPGRGGPAPFGVFVTVVQPRPNGKPGQTRGCFGNMESRGLTLDELVEEAALGAARFDPRVRPISAAELPGLQIIVSFVGPTIPVMTVSEVDPKRQGLLVRAGDRRSVLLPGEAKTATWQLRRSLRQAGIRRGQPYEMFRFQTETLYEPQRTAVRGLP